MCVKNFKLGNTGKMAADNEAETLWFFLTLSKNVELIVRWEK